jgi:hypothetical protein
MWLIVFAIFTVATVAGCFVYVSLTLPKVHTKPPALQTCQEFIDHAVSSTKEHCKTSADCRGHFGVDSNGQTFQRPYRATPANPICSTEIADIPENQMGICLPLTSTVCVRTPHSDGACPARYDEESIAHAECGINIDAGASGSGSIGPPGKSYKLQKIACLTRIPTSEASAHLMWKCVPNHRLARLATGGSCTNLRACHTDKQCGKGAICLQKIDGTVVGKCMKVCEAGKMDQCPGPYDQCVSVDNHFTRATTSCAGVSVCVGRDSSLT